MRNDMATVEAHLQFFEDALTNVEIELLPGLAARSLRARSASRDVSPPNAWADGETLLLDLERQTPRDPRLAAEKPSKNSPSEPRDTLQQIARRLSILDQEYGFIRTQIFWVRDQDPSPPAPSGRGPREFNYLLKALLRLAQETTKATLWTRPSAEFMVTAIAVLVLPVGLVKLRRALGGLIRRGMGEATG